MSHERAPELTALAADDDEWTALFSPPGHNIQLDDVNQPNAGIAMTLDGVPVSLFATHLAGRPQPDRQMIRGTLFAAAAAEEILSGKLLGRWADRAADEIPVRDLYDLTVARTVEPRALKKLARMPRDARLAAAERLRSLPEDWRLRDPKPVIDPTFEVDLPRLAKRLAQPINAGDWQQIPLTARTASATAPVHDRGLER